MPHHPNLICYYHGGINVSLLNPHVCTHIIYTSIGVDKDGSIKFPYAEEMQVLSELNVLEKMRQVNENLKLLISVGDNCNDQRKAFNSMLSCTSARKNFTKTFMKFCRKCNFNGIDLNWQQPEKQLSSQFTDLLKRFKDLMSGVSIGHDVSLPQEFDVFNFQETVDAQILSVTVNASLHAFYDIKGIAKRAKFVNLMTFDMEMPSRELMDLDRAVSLWMENGVHINRMNIGAATYGCNDSKAMRTKANYARFGGFGGLVVHAFDGDDYCGGFPLIRDAFEALFG